MIKIIEDMREEYFQKVGLITATSKVISYNNELVGIIDYDTTDTLVKIAYITINDEYRRQGIAKQVIDLIGNNNQGKYIYGRKPSEIIKLFEKLAEWYGLNDEKKIICFIQNILRNLIVNLHTNF